jgi:hypothetical protein
MLHAFVTLVKLSLMFDVVLAVDHFDYIPDSLVMERVGRHLLGRCSDFLSEQASSLLQHFQDASAHLSIHHQVLLGISSENRINE